MAQWLNRATWRQGKRRARIKRVKPLCGRLEAPAAFLEAAKRTQWTRGRPQHKRCQAIARRSGTQCGKLAMKGYQTCELHGAFSSLARKGKLIRNPRMKNETGKNSAPMELAKLKLYQSAPQETKRRLREAWQTPQWAQSIKQAILQND